MEKNLRKLVVGQAFYAEPFLPVIPQVVGELAQLQPFDRFCPFAGWAVTLQKLFLVPSTNKL